MTTPHEIIARVCHEANCALQRAFGDPNPSPPWEDAPDWQRESAVRGIETALAGATPEQQHEAWCRDKLAAGWRYGETKDADAKTHPCLVPYAELPPEQRAKDYVYGAIVRAMGAAEAPRP